jgi:hypothetical protein
VRAIESWVVRRTIVGANSRGYGKRFVDLIDTAKAALKSGREPGEAICTSLAEASENAKWPLDIEVLDAFCKRSMYGNLNQLRIRLLLGAIDGKMQSDDKRGEGPIFDYEKLQIEHILPQKWRKHWPVGASDLASRHLAEQVREQAVDLMGNLTLVTEKLNPEMSNGPWEVKCKALTDHSKLHLNRGVVKIAIWDEAQIEKRAKVLAEVACQIWPAPGTLLELVRVPD